MHRLQAKTVQNNSKKINFDVKFWMKRYYGLFTCNFVWKQQFQVKIILMIDLTNTQLFTLQ